MENDKIKTKVCRECGKELPIEMFSTTSTYADGHLPYCKECAKKKWKRTEFLHYNMALDRIPWPFDEPWHEMDIEAIHESIKQKHGA